LRCSVPGISGKSGTIGFAAGFIFAPRKLEEDALKKILIVGALAFAATAIAETANAAEIYVVRDATTKKCTIVDTKPTTTTTTIVDNGTFKTKTEAETGMKTMKVCTTN
jgi:hypothetical protein